MYSETEIRNAFEKWNKEVENNPNKFDDLPKDKNLYADWFIHLLKGGTRETWDE